MTNEEQAALKMLVDRHGVYTTLDALSGICGNKAEYIRQTWQDHDLAGEWEKAEAAIDKAASAILAPAINHVEDKMNEAIVALRRLLEIADKLIPSDNPSNEELYNAELAIQAAYVVLNDCTCDEGGSAGCPRHDPAIKAT